MLGNRSQEGVRTVDPTVEQIELVNVTFIGLFPCSETSSRGHKAGRCARSSRHSSNKTAYLQAVDRQAWVKWSWSCRQVSSLCQNLAPVTVRPNWHTRNPRKSSALGNEQIILRVGFCLWNASTILAGGKQSQSLGALRCGSAVLTVGSFPSHGAENEVSRFAPRGSKGIPPVPLCPRETFSRPCWHVCSRTTPAERITVQVSGMAVQEVIDGRNGAES
ncbi:MAG: hypothetical protein KatS3mg081_1640 [Gemmatimonadales bacterium]|nr:MAG: hypothetical protein KatS3mg081_1640 [Gemmatimonadales bacterium]